MKTFPKYLKPENLKKFDEYKFNRKLCYTRKHVYENMMKSSFINDKNYGINLQNIQIGEMTSSNSCYNIDKKIIDHISLELCELGWKTSVCYGGTMLFIYPPGENPVEVINCIMSDPDQ